MNKAPVFLVLLLSIVFATACTTEISTQQSTNNPTSTTEQPSSMDAVDSQSSPSQTTGMTASYTNYSEEAFTQSADKKRVLFFHAAWCPTCKVANQEFESKRDQIPADVVLLKTDYDTQSALKKKYAITYQHTFVLVDAQGNEIKKWNGGGIRELVANTK